MTDTFDLGLSSIPLVAPVVVDRSGQPILGSTTIVVEIRQIGTSNRWDFTGDTFRTSGWTTRQGALAQVDSTLDPGVYERTAGWVATNVAAGTYLVTYRDTSGAAANLPAYEAIRLVASTAAPSAAAISAQVNADLTSAHGSGDYRTPATVTLADGSLTAAKVGAGFVDVVQLGLATRAAELFDVEIVTTPSGESIYFPYFKGGSPVLGATLSMSVSRIGIVMVEGVPTEAFETLDFSAEIFVAPADNTVPTIAMEPLDAAYPGIYTQHFSQEFPGNAVSPDIYTVWIYDGAQLVGMGRLRIGMADTIIATGADVAALPATLAGAHGAGSWATATGFATPTNVTDGVTATLAGIVSAHGAGSYVTASVAGLATSSDVATAVAAIEAYGQAHWQTATGFAVPGDAMTLADGALLPAKIGAGFVNAMQANLALEASLTAMKGASFDGATDSLRAMRVLVSALPTVGAPSAATIRDAVWAASDDAPTAGSRGWELWRLAQWGTETNPKKIVGNELRLYTPGLGSVLATVTLHDAAGNDIAPGTGEPAQYLP